MFLDVIDNYIINSYFGRDVIKIRKENFDAKKECVENRYGRGGRGMIRLDAG